MPADLELALRVRADMREALRGIGTLNRSLGDTALRGDQAGAALTGATGAAQAFTTALGALGRESGSTLGQARDAAESVFGAMESALARFVTTGRVSFSGFVDSVIADLARLATRRYITQPLADLLFGALGGGATPGSAVFGRLQAGVGHTGAVAGQPGGVRRAVPPAVFALRAPLPLWRCCRPPAGRSADHRTTWRNHPAARRDCRSAFRRDQLRQSRHAAARGEPRGAPRSARPGRLDRHRRYPARRADPPDHATRARRRTPMTRGKGRAAQRPGARDCAPRRTARSQASGASARRLREKNK